MKWLITGAGGQLGKTLTALLQAAGAEVESHSRQSLDISDESEVASAIERSRPEILVNCAAWTDVDGAEEDTEGAIRANATGAQNLAKVANAIGARLIHISTDFVFGADNKEIYSEDDPPCPVNFYGASKALGEKLVSLENPEAVILRASWLYSPHGKNFPKAIIRKLITDESSISVVDDQVGQPTSCSSLTQTIKLIGLRQELRGIFHGSSQGHVSRFEFAQEIAAQLGYKSSRIQPISSSSLNLQAKRPSRTILKHDKHVTENIEMPALWNQDLASQIIEIKKSVESEASCLR